MEQLGAGIQKAQSFYGQVAVDDQVNRVMSAADTIRRGDPSKVQVGPDGKPVLGPDGKPQPDLGFFGLRGEDAMRAGPGVQTQIDQTIAAARANLTSPEQKLQFDEQTRRMRSAWANEIGDHLERQAQSWGVGVTDSAAGLALQHIGANPENPEEVKHGLADLVQYRVRRAQLAFGNDPTVAADAAQKARAEGATAQVEALVDKNPALARQVLEGNRTILPPDTYDRLVGRLRPELAGFHVDQAIRDAGAPPTGDRAPAPATASPSGSAPNDADVLAARQRIWAGTGTDADRATVSAYLKDQNTPQRLPQAGAAPATNPAAPPVSQADRDAAFKRSMALQKPGHVMTQAEHDQLVRDNETLARWGQQGGKPVAAPARQPAAVPLPPARPAQPDGSDAGAAVRNLDASVVPPSSPSTLPQPTYQQWRAVQSPADRREFDRIALEIASQKKTTLPAQQKIMFSQLVDTANARRVTLEGLPLPRPNSATQVGAGTPTFLQGREAPAPNDAGTRLAYFSQIGAKYGISGDYLNRVYGVEGTGKNPKSSASGYFQFIPTTAASYGVNRFDFASATDGAARLAADNRHALTRSLGRAPSDAELYLAHQQGSAGAATLLLHPSMAAADALALSAPYSGNRAKAAAAISSNGGNPDASASAFVAHWEAVYAGRRPGNGPVPTFAAPGQTPYPTDALGPEPLPPITPEPAPLPDAAPPAPPPTLLQSAPGASQAPPPPPSLQAPGQAGAAGGSSPNPDDAAAGLPDKAAVLARAVALAGDDPIQRRLNVAEVNRRYAEQSYLTQGQRAELSQSLPDYMAAASAGRTDIDFPEREVWRLFPAPKARQIVDTFHASQAVGSMMRGAEWASPDQLAAMQRDIDSGQGVYSDSLRTHRGRASTGAGTAGADPDAGDLAFFKRREVASRQIAAEIDRRTRLLVGPDADPAAYVAANPAVRQAAAAVNQQDPASYGRFATASLEMQGYLGVPEAQRHVLTRGQALEMAGQITGSQDPKAALGQLAAATGSAWPQVFRDAIALGKLPAGYQAVATLDDPHDAALLARTFAEEKPGPDGKPGRSVDDTVDVMAGAKGEATRIRDAVRYDPNVKSYVASIQRSGASDGQVMGIVNAVETLALAKRSAGEAGDSASAASAAVKSFFAKFDYLPNGGARVPAKVFDAVSANARIAIDGLAPESIAVPPRFGQPGQPEPREYVDTIKAAPTWITSPRSDAIWLMDYAGRIVRGRDGQPVSVPFDRPAPASDNRSGLGPSADVVPGL